MFCYHNKRILLHKYQQNIFVDLTKLFSQCSNDIKNSFSSKMSVKGSFTLNGRTYLHRTRSKTFFRLVRNSSNSLE